VVEEQLVQLSRAQDGVLEADLMPAFFVEPGDVDGDRLTLVGEEAHHVRVRRCREGDILDIIDGSGAAYKVRVQTLTPERVDTEIMQRLPEWGESAVDLHLAAAVPKGSRFDLVIEKATEVGVRSITPLICERGVVRPGNEERRLERWHRLARAAAKQCGRSRVPRVTEPLPLMAAADDLQRHCGCMLVAGPEGGQQLAEALCGSAGAVGLFIGPEGGFDPAESTALIELGARPVTWGERVLRAETAAVVLSALVLDHALTARSES
jgi:16S rRNA (uracil1498-N3)-methyltransferase